MKLKPFLPPERDVSKEAEHGGAAYQSGFNRAVQEIGKVEIGLSQDKLYNFLGEFRHPDMEEWWDSLKKELSKALSDNLENLIEVKG